MDFLDFIRKVHEEKKAQGLVIKGGPGSGWYAPPKGTHGKGKKKTKVLDFSKMSKSEREKTIRNLKATDTLKLYHGTRQLDTAKKICQEGFDPTKKPGRGRIYHGKGAPEKGFFVSPDKHVSQGFGSYVIEFNTKAKDLNPRPQPGMYDKSRKELDDFWRGSYPHSFSPALSADLSMGESQGLLTNKVSSNKVKAVWRWRYDDPKKRTGGEWYSTNPGDFLKEGD